MEIIETEMHEEANETCDHNVAENSEVVDDDDQQQLRGDIVISIEEMLGQLPKIAPEPKDICQIPKELLEMNEKAYIPQFISIGPFHHATRKDLIANERYKLQGFHNFLRRLNSNDITPQSLSLKDLVEISHVWVKEARNCYDPPIIMEEKEFVIMMLVDACFILEFFIQNYDYPIQETSSNDDFSSIVDDFSFDYGVKFHILLDLIKLENQVPFFLLQKLCNLIPLIDDADHTSFLIQITKSALTHYVSMDALKMDLKNNLEPKHLVDFLCFYFVPSPSDDMQTNNKYFYNTLLHLLFPANRQKPQHDHDEKNSENNNYFLSSFCFLFPTNRQKQQHDHDQDDSKKKNDYLSFLLCRLWQKNNDSEEEIEILPPSITELCESGVTIKKAQNSTYLTNISFKNGVLEIPPLHIYDHFELMLRNMLAFEQFGTTSYMINYVTQYLLFMDDLISTEKDVRLLVNVGVIINSIGGSDKEISDMFNDLCKFAGARSSHYKQISKDLRKHCNGRWNKAKASLKHNYFYTPWAIISVIAATFLIILTLLQTIFSAISTFPKPT